MESPATGSAKVCVCVFKGMPVYIHASFLCILTPKPNETRDTDTCTLNPTFTGHGMLLVLPGFELHAMECGRIGAVLLGGVACQPPW